MSNSSVHGFSLIEVLVGMLIGVGLVVAVGVLGGSLVRHRANADSLSAACNIAERQIERLRSLDDPSSNALLADGRHPSSGTLLCDETGLDVDGVGNLAGPYEIFWEVDDDQPQTGSKEITVTVTHANNDFVECQLETYYLLPAS